MKIFVDEAEFLGEPARGGGAEVSDKVSVLENCSTLAIRCIMDIYKMEAMRAVYR